MVKRFDTKIIFLIAAVVMLLVLWARPVHAGTCPHCKAGDLKQIDTTYTSTSEDTCVAVTNYECEVCLYMETKSLSIPHAFNVLEKTVEPLSLQQHKVITSEACTNCKLETKRITKENHDAVWVKEGDKSVYKCKVCGQVIKTQKAKNPLSIKGKTAKVKYSKLQKKKQTIKTSKAFTASGAQGRVTYKLVSVKEARFMKYFKMTSAGKITVKKGLKKGTYKLKVNVTAAGNANYDAATKVIKLKVIVK